MNLLLEPRVVTLGDNCRQGCRLAEAPRPETSHVAARPAPKVSTSAELAARRNEQAQRQPDIKMVITPLEGLGVPAVRSELEGSSPPTIEAVGGRRLLGVTTSDFEASKALVPKAAARLH